MQRAQFSRTTFHTHRTAQLPHPIVNDKTTTHKITKKKNNNPIFGQLTHIKTRQLTHTSNEISAISVFALSLFQGIEPTETIEPIERQNTKVYNKPQK